MRHLYKKKSAVSLTPEDKAKAKAMMVATTSIRGCHAKWAKK
jgi:hypothetical protein